MERFKMGRKSNREAKNPSKLIVVGPLRFELKIARAPGVYPNPC